MNHYRCTLATARVRPLLTMSDICILGARVLLGSLLLSYIIRCEIHRSTAFGTIVLLDLLVGRAVVKLIIVLMLHLVRSNLWSTHLIWRLWWLPDVRVRKLCGLERNKWRAARSAMPVDRCWRDHMLLLVTRGILMIFIFLPHEVIWVQCRNFRELSHLLLFLLLTLQLLLKNAWPADCLFGLNELEPVNLLLLTCQAFPLVSFVGCLVGKRLSVEIVIGCAYLSAFVYYSLFNLLWNNLANDLSFDRILRSLFY